MYYSIKWIDNLSGYGIIGVEYYYKKDICTIAYKDQMLICYKDIRR